MAFAAILVAAAFAAACTAAAQTLTPRQTEVLQSLTMGLTNRDIARQLSISEDRVEQHVRTLLEKLGAANRTEAVALAFRKHLLKI